MPRDARLGFVVGVGLVILIAVVFYHRDGKAGITGNVATSREEEAATPITARASGPRTHTVREGETLQSIAVRYYGDGTRAKVLRDANLSQLGGSEQVPTGSVVVVPRLPE